MHLRGMSVTYSKYPLLTLVSLNCGDTSGENCTYFEGTNIVPGSCKAEICPCNNNICQVIIIYWYFLVTLDLIYNFAFCHISSG